MPAHWDNSVSVASRDTCHICQSGFEILISRKIFREFRQNAKNCFQYFERWGYMRVPYCDNEGATPESRSSKLFQNWWATCLNALGQTTEFVLRKCAFKFWIFYKVNVQFWVLSNDLSLSLILSMRRGSERLGWASVWVGPSEGFSFWGTIWAVTVARPLCSLVSPIGWRSIKLSLSLSLSLWARRRDHEACEKNVGNPGYLCIHRHTSHACWFEKCDLFA